MAVFVTLYVLFYFLMVQIGFKVIQEKEVDRERGRMIRMGYMNVGMMGWRRGERNVSLFHAFFVILSFVILLIYWQIFNIMLILCKFGVSWLLEKTHFGLCFVVGFFYTREIGITKIASSKMGEVQD